MPEFRVAFERTATQRCILYLEAPDKAAAERLALTETHRFSDWHEVDSSMPVVVAVDQASPLDSAPASK